ncbi:MAG: DUF4147 domain-containing protein [Candidatus Paceibacterota bacterium]
MSNQSYIKNTETLTKGDQRRLEAITIVEAGYRAIDTPAIIREKVRLDGETLYFGDKTYHLPDYKNIFVIGFGKISCQAAATLEQILGGLIKKGTVIGMADNLCQIIDTYVGTHPMPSAANVAASKKILELSKEVDEDDLVIVVVSGGGSSLLCPTETEAEQGQRLYQKFLTTGGTIHELNTVRKHISILKGGGLAEALYPAEVVGLIFCDVPGEQYELVASGATYRDNSTVADAQAIIDRYNLGQFELIETTKDNKYFERVTNIPLTSSHTATAAMAKKAEELGFTATVIGNDLTMPMTEAVDLFTAQAKTGQALVAAGELSLIVGPKNTGQGGRNTFFALTMLEKLKANQVFVAFASDGYDNTEAAGALIDSKTKTKAEQLNLNIGEYLKQIDSFNFFRQTNDLIMTGRIESNVSDLMLLLEYPKANEK